MGKTTCNKGTPIGKFQAYGTETFSPMEPVGTDDGFEVIFVNTVLISKNGNKRAFSFIGKDSGYVYHQRNLGIRYKGRKKKGMCVSTLFTVNPGDS